MFTIDNMTLNGISVTVLLNKIIKHSKKSRQLETFKLTADKDERLCVIDCLTWEYISRWNDVAGLENKQSIVTTKKPYRGVLMDTIKSTVC